MSTPAAYRLLPSVEEALLRLEPIVREQAAGPTARERAATLVRELLDSYRAAIKAGTLDEPGLRGRLAQGELERAFRALLLREARAGLARVVNATGVVLHTGLGRAAVHPEVASAMRTAAESYVLLEVDRATGQRNERDQHLSKQLVQLTGAEAAIAVNNNAAAVYLVLSTFAHGAREVVVSRGELVEIGGSFRVPDVMARAGVTLREVGTTNRTHLRDYEQAIGERTALLMKIHTSNFRVRGFVHEVDPRELAELAHARRLACAFDLGSGLLDPAQAPPLVGLGDEPKLSQAVASGCDLVTFSGDKLLGAPQAGLIVGRREAVAQLRKNPIYRALRLDKVTLAGLEATFELMLQGRGGELPVRRMLLATAEQLRPAAERLARELARIPGLSAEVRASQSQPGSGSAPDVFLPTFAVRVVSAKLSEEELAARLRAGEPCVFARVQEGALLLDPRTLLEGDLERLVAAVRAAHP
jgi:L-seryl-tRNA(Ser) seleniumtransferase